MTIIFLYFLNSIYHHKLMGMVTTAGWNVFMCGRGAEEASYWTQSCFHNMLCRDWAVFFYVHQLALFYIIIIAALFFAQSSPGSPETTAQSQPFVQFLWATSSDSAAPTDGCNADCLLPHRCVPSVPQSSLSRCFLKTASLLHFFSSLLSR